MKTIYIILIVIAVLTLVVGVIGVFWEQREARRGLGKLLRGIAWFSVIGTAILVGKAIKRFFAKKHQVFRNLATEPDNLVRSGEWKNLHDELGCDSREIEGKEWTLVDARHDARVRFVGDRTIKCETKGEDKYSCMVQSILLRQSEPIPIEIGGWCRCRNVSVRGHENFSIWADLWDENDKLIRAIVAPVAQGTHEWIRVRNARSPGTPVSKVHLHCLIRGGSGVAWFDGVYLRQLWQK